jgi:hypothetical protein
MWLAALPTFFCRIVFDYTIEVRFSNIFDIVYDVDVYMN